MRSLLPRPASHTMTGGHPEAHCRRTIVDAIRYVTDNGCKWRSLPADFPPWQTVYGFFTRWQAVITQAHHVLRDQVRINAGRNTDPTAAVIDSQSIKACATVAKSTRGYDAGKKINGRKRHIAVDTMGLLLLVMVTPANLADRTAARGLLFRLRVIYGGIACVWADGGYAGKLPAWAARFLDMTIHVVPKIVGQTTFIPLKRRWVVERSLAWITQRRRLTRDYERKPTTSETFIYWANTITLTRRLTTKG